MRIKPHVGLFYRIKMEVKGVTTVGLSFNLMNALGFRVHGENKTTFCNFSSFQIIILNDIDNKIKYYSIDIILLK